MTTKYYIYIYTHTFNTFTINLLETKKKKNFNAFINTIKAISILRLYLTYRIKFILSDV